MSTERSYVISCVIPENSDVFISRISRWDIPVPHHSKKWIIKSFTALVQSPHKNNVYKTEKVRIGYEEKYINLSGKTIDEICEIFRLNKFIENGKIYGITTVPLVLGPYTTYILGCTIDPYNIIDSGIRFSKSINLSGKYGVLRLSTNLTFDDIICDVEIDMTKMVNVGNKMYVNSRNNKLCLNDIVTNYIEFYTTDRFNRPCLKNPKTEVIIRLELTDISAPFENYISTPWMDIINQEQSHKKYKGALYSYTSYYDSSSSYVIPSNDNNINNNITSYIDLKETDDDVL